MPVSLNLNSNELNKDSKKPEPRIRVPQAPKAKLSATPSTSPKETAKKVKGKSNKKKIFGIVFGIIVLLGSVGGAIAYNKAQQISNDIGINIKASDLINPKKDPELKKDSSGKLTNALIVGIDTRENDKGLQNTDTMIVASYNHESGKTVMISLPRDLYVAVPNQGWSSKINGVYNAGEQVEEDEGLPLLKEAVEDTTGLEIQYYGMIDLQGFIEIIDTIGGIEVNVERSFIDLMYPKQGGVSFEKGPQTMDGETALEFARSRQAYTPPIEASDFARARRQQKVINAVKEKILSSETYLDPQKLLGILTSVQNHVKLSDFTYEDIQAGINIAKNNKDPKTYGMVLDPALGNFGLLESGPEYTVIPTAGGTNYADIREYISLYISDPDIYEEAPVIYVYDTGLGYAATQQRTAELREKYPYISITFAGTLFKDKEGIIVYDQTDNQNPSTIERFSKTLGTENKVKPEYITTKLNGEDVTIFFGKEPVAPTAAPTAQP